MAKIGLIVQRYGLEVNGGAEYHARVLAEELATSGHTIEVLTTCAISYHDWKNEYPQGESETNEIKIIRFANIIKDHRKFRSYRRRILKNRKKHRHLKKLKLFDFFDKKQKFEPTENDCYNWLKHQGPYCPTLVEYLETNSDNYDCFIFFTYLYYPTAIGMQKVGHKSIFIPTAHDEPLFYTKPYQKVFSLPKFIMYNTLSEKELVEKTYPNVTPHNAIGGVGIEKNKISETINSQKKYNLTDDYFLYIGRIDSSKGCDELINYFNQYRIKNQSLKLVFVGQNFMNISGSEGIIFTGFIDNDVKNDLLKNCSALIIPSKFESLSLVTLEAMIESKLVIASSQCEVIKNHIDTSTAGFYYNSYNEFETCLNKVLNMSNNELKTRTNKGVEYVTQNYSWGTIINKFNLAIDFITSAP